MVKNNKKNAGRRRNRTSNYQTNLPQSAPSRASPSNVINQPGFYPRVCLTRLVEGTFDVTNDGVNPTLAAINFSLNDIPGYTEMTSMFQTYCIEQVDIWWRPEYTQLVDSAALSNAVNVEFNSAIDQVDSAAPTSVPDVLQYQNAAHTSITKTHFRKIRPAYLIDSQVPSCARISTSAPSVNWFGIKIGINPCGVAMTFRSTARFKVVLTGLK
jgi:hypothetical protein